MRHRGASALTSSGTLQLRVPLLQSPNPLVSRILTIFHLTTPSFFNLCHYIPSHRP